MSTPSSLSEDQVAEWLSKQVGLPQYASLFTDNDIDGSILISLSEDDLEKLGIKSLGHRKKILKAIENYEPVKSTPAAAATPASQPAKLTDILDSKTSSSKPSPTAGRSLPPTPKKTNSASSSSSAASPAVQDSEEERLRKLREENDAKRKAKLSFMKKGNDTSAPKKPAFSPAKKAPPPQKRDFLASKESSPLSVSDTSWQNKAKSMSGLDGGPASSGEVDDEQSRLRRLEEENRLKATRKHAFLRNSAPTTPAGEDNASWRQQEKQRVIQMEMRARQERMAAGKQGYMSVKVPFAEGAKEKVKSLVSGSVNFVELIVNDSDITAGFSGTVSNSQLPSKLDATNPRFALISFKHVSQTGQERTATVFVYCCPANSPKNLRMVYATAKPSALQQISALGARVDKSVEVNASSDLTEKVLVEELYFSGASAYQDFKAPEFDRHYIKNPHPLFGSKGRRGVDHNVVLAPVEAYGSSTRNV